MQKSASPASWSLNKKPEMNLFNLLVRKRERHSSSSVWKERTVRRKTADFLLKVPFFFILLVLFKDLVDFVDLYEVWLL